MRRWVGIITSGVGLRRGCRCGGRFGVSARAVAPCAWVSTSRKIAAAGASASGDGGQAADSQSAIWSVSAGGSALCQEGGLEY